MEHNDHRFRGISERWREGNETAFKELYDALSGHVFSYLLSRTKSRDEALDLLQEVFLALWSARLRFVYENDALLYGFVFTIARRTLVGHYKRNRKETMIRELPVDDRYTMDTEAIDAVHVVERAMDHLSEDDRDLITLRSWNGLSFDEIAAMKGRKETAVRVKHHRAMQKLKAIIDHHD